MWFIVMSDGMFVVVVFAVMMSRLMTSVMA